MNVEEFRQRIITEDFDEVLNTILLGPGASHFEEVHRQRVVQKLAERYNVPSNEINLVIVGSAKLGFSISEKRLKDGTILPRYRPFRPESDIDTAIVSPAIFEAIWNELSQHGFSRPFIPWDTGKLGDYMTCGWLRPDHFPKTVRLRKCDDWWDTFRSLSAQRILGRRQVRGGLFFNLHQLRAYQARALKECINFEKTQL